jgi:hypothetical protein
MGAPVKLLVATSVEGFSWQIDGRCQNVTINLYVTSMILFGV